MTDTSFGDELDRYAAINSAFLKINELDYLDVSYEEYINSLKNTSWNSTTAEGGKYCFFLLVISFWALHCTDVSFKVI